MAVLNFAVSDAVRQQVDEVKVRTDAASVSEVVRRAIRVYAQISAQDVVEIVLRKADGTERTVKFL